MSDNNNLFNIDESLISSLSLSSAEIEKLESEIARLEKRDIEGEKIINDVLLNLKMSREDYIKNIGFFYSFLKGREECIGCQEKNHFFCKKKKNKGVIPTLIVDNMYKYFRIGDTYCEAKLSFDERMKQDLLFTSLDRGDLVEYYRQVDNDIKNDVMSINEKTIIVNIMYMLRRIKKEQYNKSFVLNYNHILDKKYSNPEKLFSYLIVDQLLNSSLSISYYDFSDETMSDLSSDTNYYHDFQTGLKSDICFINNCDCRPQYIPQFLKIHLPEMLKKREEKGKLSIFYFSKTDKHISFLKDKLNGSLSEIEIKEIFNNLF